MSDFFCIGINFICLHWWGLIYTSSVRLMDTGLWNSAGDAGRVRIQVRKHTWSTVYMSIEAPTIEIESSQRSLSAKCKSPIDCVACKHAHAQFITSFPVHLRDAQSIVLHRRFIVICPWAYKTIYGWRSMEMDLCQLLLLAGFAGTYYTHYGYYH